MSKITDASASMVSIVLQTFTHDSLGSAACSGTHRLETNSRIQLISGFINKYDPEYLTNGGSYELKIFKLGSTRSLLPTLQLVTGLVCQPGWRCIDLFPVASRRTILRLNGPSTTLINIAGYFEEVSIHIIPETYVCANLCLEDNHPHQKIPNFSDAEVLQRAAGYTAEQQV
jgi:hypothetical protein